MLDRPSGGHESDNIQSYRYGTAVLSRERIIVGKTVFTNDLPSSFFERAFANCGQIFLMDFRFKKGAKAPTGTTQNTVSTMMKRVTVQDMSIRVDRGRYVFGHTTSEGAGAGCATRRVGDGSSTAWMAIC
jgi:hypothetical protein